MTHVGLRRTKISDAGIALLAEAIAAANERIESVHLEYCGITASSFRTLNLPATAKTLYLSRNWGSEGLGAVLANAPADFSPLPPQLETLVLQDTRFLNLRDAELFFHHLPRSLGRLSLRGTKIKSSVVHAFARSLPPNLHSLDLSECSLSDGDLDAICPHLPKTITHLQLANNRFIWDGAFALAGHLPPGLLVLDLLGNIISDAGVEYLAERLPAALGVLDLGCTGITDAGVTAVMTHLPAQLEHLRLGEALVSMAIVEVIFGNVPPTLQSGGFQPRNTGGPGSGPTGSGRGRGGTNRYSNSGGPGGSWGNDYQQPPYSHGPPHQHHHQQQPYQQHQQSHPIPASAGGSWRQAGPVSPNAHAYAQSQPPPPPQHQQSAPAAAAHAPALTADQFPALGTAPPPAPPAWGGKPAGSASSNRGSYAKAGGNSPTVPSPTSATNGGGAGVSPASPGQSLGSAMFGMLVEANRARAHQENEFSATEATQVMGKRLEMVQAAEHVVYAAPPAAAGGEGGRIGSRAGYLADGTTSFLAHLREQTAA
ncbi:hypothetical protein H9P43_000239 [Blastocladiella emersonii ATCC 22665]|nr:hypothetical protein H9P43_000239 [Blastocladiella emersonii ATCC 22665]